MNYQTEDLKKVVEKNYYVFCGQNATTGTPHPTTGRMSCYGSYLAFETKKYAQEYVDNYTGLEMCVAGTAMMLRKYSLGISLHNYYDALYFLDVNKEME